LIKQRANISEKLKIVACPFYLHNNLNLLIRTCVRHDVVPDLLVIDNLLEFLNVGCLTKGSGMLNIATWINDDCTFQQMSILCDFGVNETLVYRKKKLKAIRSLLKIAFKLEFL
jgi:hypothetical protein